MGRKNAVISSNRVLEEKHAGVLRGMARVAVDRSKGRLEAFSGKYFVTDELLKHIPSRSRSSASLRLRRLSLVSCHEVTNKGFTELVTISPKLEELSLELCPNVGGRHVLESAGRACPRLRRFSLRRECFRFSRNYSRRTDIYARTTTTTSWRPSSTDARLETLCLRDCYKVIADA